MVRNVNVDADALQMILDKLCEIDSSTTRMDLMFKIGQATMMAKLALGSRADETAYKAMHERALR